MDYNIPMLASAAHVPQMPMQSPDSQLPLQVQPFQTVNPVAQEHQAMKMIGERNQMQDEQRQREEANNDRASLEALHSSGVNLSTPEGIDEALQKQGWSQKTIDGLLKRKQAILTNASLMQEHLSKVDARKLADIHSTMEETLRDMTRPMEKYDAAIKSGKDTVAATSAFNDTAAAIVTYYRGRKNADGTPLVPPEKLEQMAKWSVDDWRHNVDEADFKVKQVSTALKNKKYQAETGLIEKKTQLLDEGATAVAIDALEAKREAVLIDDAEYARQYTLLTTPKGRGGAATTASRKSVADIPPDEREQLVDRLGSYLTNPSKYIGAMAARDPANEILMNEVQRKYPDYDSSKYPGMVKNYTNFMAGPDGRVVRSFGTANRHLDTLAELGKDLKNDQVPAWNVFANYINKATGAAAPSNFEAAKMIIADEVLKGVLGGQGALKDREQLAASIKGSSSPEQMMGFIKTARDLIAGQLQGYRNQFTAGGGTDAQFDNMLGGKSIISRQKKPDAPAEVAKTPESKAAGVVAPMDIEQGRMRVKELGGLEPAKKHWTEMHDAWSKAKGEEKTILKQELDVLLMGIHEADMGPPAIAANPGAVNRSKSGKPMVKINGVWEYQ